MIIHPKKIINKGMQVCFSKSVEVIACRGLDVEWIKKKISQSGVDVDSCEKCNKIEFISPIPDFLIEKNNGLINEDAYVIDIGIITRVYCNNFLGAHYAVSYLCNKKDELFESEVYDYPYKDIRGYKMFIPSDEEFESVTEHIMDMLVEYRYNTIVLEIGGAMEYKRRPEINKTWVELCEDVMEYSGKGDDISLGKLYAWPKNVLHVDNGGGGFVSQEKLKAFALACAKMGIKIVPEVPSLSHCDYIVKAYPQVRERIEDIDYPDCYCPNNPETYEILFDILDEVCEVFSPEYIHIGHDELFSIALCDRCRETKPETLFVEDVKKIQKYLGDKGIKIMMWADMLSKECERLGGAGRSVPGDPQYVPPMYMIRDMLPRDILMVDWWYEADKNHINVLEECGFTTVFGNLSMHLFTDWTRVEKECVVGGIVSNWGSLKDMYMQANGQNFDIIFNSFIFWNGEIKEERKREMFDAVLQEGYRYLGNNGDGVDIVMSTDLTMDIGAFYDGNFIDESVLELGRIVFELKNGEKKVFRVLYGINIMNADENSIRELTRLCGGAVPTYESDKILCRCRYDGGFKKEDIISSVFEKTKNDDFKFQYKII